MEKGTKVTVRSGKDRGKTGVVVWFGKSKYGDGMRVGLKTDDGETVWASESAIAEGSDAAPPEDSAGAEAAAQSGFRLYGDFPDDWIEGANDGHGFSVQFDCVPIAEQLKSIAALYETVLSEGLASPAQEPWQWAERFAHFHVGERGMAGAAILGPVKRFLYDAHRIAPIRDVVYLNAREGASGPDQPPDPGPAGWQYCGQFGRQVDPALPALATVEEFEQARVEASLGAADHKALEQIEREISALHGDKGAILDHYQGEPPVTAPPSGEAQALFDAALATPNRDLHERVWQPPLALVVVQRDQGSRVIAYTRGDGTRELELPKATWEECCAAVRPDGQKVLVGGNDIIVEVDLANRSVCTRRVPAQGEDLCDLAYLDADRLAVLTGDRLYVLEPGKDRDEIVDHIDINRGGIEPLLGGKVIVAFSSIGKPLFYAFVHGRLKKLGGFKSGIDTIVEHDGRILASFTPDAEAPRKWFEVLGLEEALAKAEATKPRKKRTAKAAIQMVTHKALPDDLRSSDLAKRPVQLERRWNRKFSSRFKGWGNKYTTVPAALSARGVLATIVKPTLIELSEAKGKVKSLRKFAKNKEVTQLEFDPTGRYLFACCGGWVTRFDLDNNHKRQTVLNDPSKPMQLCAISGERLIGYFHTGVCQIVLEDGTWTLKGVKKVPQYSTAALSPALETVFLIDSSRGARAYAAVGDKMIELWNKSMNCTRASFVGARVFIHLNWVEQFPAIELMGLEAALETMRSKPARKKKAAKKPTKKPTKKSAAKKPAAKKPAAKKPKKQPAKKPEIEHEKLDPKTVPDDSFEQAIYAQLGITGKTDKLHCRQSASGLSAALCDPDGLGYYQTLVIDGEASPRRIDVAPLSHVRGFDVAPDGSVYITTLEGFSQLDLETVEPKTLLELNLDKRPINYGADVCALDDDTLLALGTRQLVVLKRDDAGQWQNVAKRNIKEGKRLYPLRPLGLVVLLSDNERERVLVLGVKKNYRLQVLTYVSGWLRALRVVDGRQVFVRTVDDKAWELKNLAAMVDGYGLLPFGESG